MDSVISMSAAGRAAMETIFLVSGPILGSVMAVGVIVSILQAATQVSELTLSFVPKFISALLILALGGPWMLRQLESLFVTILGGPLGPGT